MKEESTSIEDIVEFHTFTFLNLIEYIKNDFEEPDGAYIANQAIDWWQKTYDRENGKCLPEGFLDVYAFSVANEQMRKFYLKVKKGFDYLEAKE